MMYHYKSKETMKAYITPELIVNIPNMVLMMDKGSDPDPEGEILGKGRWDNEDDVKKETDSWTDGLW